MKWFINALKHYADFSGRARRKEFWMFVLFSNIFSIVFVFLIMLMYAFWNLNLLMTGWSYIYYITCVSYMLVLSLPAMAVAVRRLHDIGKSGAMIFVSLIPIAGPIWFLVLMATRGQPGENIYGQIPDTADTDFDKFKRAASAGIAFIVSSSALILAGLISILAFFIKYNILNHFFLIDCAAYIFLLIAGICLVKEKTVCGIQENETGIKLLLAAVSILFLYNIYILTGSIQNMRIFGAHVIGIQVIILNIINIISGLFLVFAVLILLTQKFRNFLNITSFAVIAFSGLSLVLEIYNRAGMNPESFIGISLVINFLLGFFNILIPAVYIVFAGSLISAENAKDSK